MSTLRKYQKDPRALLSTALSMFRSRAIRTAIVEGICDKRFLAQWVPANAKVRFDGFDGKTLVEQAYQSSKVKPYSDFDFLYFFADVDFDIVTKQELHDHPSFIYNAFCFQENRLHHNDLETYLINTNAFEKVLTNFDLDKNEIDSLRSKLEKASRIIGSLRAADPIVQKSNKLRSSVLNGLEIRGFFNPHDLSFNEGELIKAIPRWSNHPLYVDDLCQMAKRIDRESPTLWTFTRGHDVTEMLALHLEHKGHKGMTGEKIELLLRLACEFTDFEKSPMGRQLSNSGGLAVFRTGAGD